MLLQRLTARFSFYGSWFRTGPAIFLQFKKYCDALLFKKFVHTFSWFIDSNFKVEWRNGVWTRVRLLICSHAAIWLWFSLFFDLFSQSINCSFKVYYYVWTIKILWIVSRLAMFIEFVGCFEISYGQLITRPKVKEWLVRVTFTIFSSFLCWVFAFAKIRYFLDNVFKSEIPSDFISIFAPISFICSILAIPIFWLRIK